MKGLLSITMPGQRGALAKAPYRTPTYSQVADASRISVKDQAEAYALWLMKNDRHHCHVYPMKKNALAASNEFRRRLLGFHRGHLRFKEVNPTDFLGPYKEGAQ